jgi:hypothetical protein
VPEERSDEEMIPQVPPSPPKATPQKKKVAKSPVQRSPPKAADQKKAPASKFLILIL